MGGAGIGGAGMAGIGGSYGNAGGLNNAYS